MQGESTFPKIWTFITYSRNFSFSLSRQIKRNASRSSGMTNAWWNIYRMSAITQYFSFWKRHKIAINLFKRSGPSNKCLFNEEFWYSAAASNTTLILFDLLAFRLHDVEHNLQMVLYLILLPVLILWHVLCPYNLW